MPAHQKKLHNEAIDDLFAQAKVRTKVGVPVIVVMSAVTWYWDSTHGPMGLIGVAAIAALYLAYIACIDYLVFSLKHSIKQDAQKVARMVTATAILDPLILSAWLATAGELGRLLVPFYLFTILGFGFRMGPRPMVICQIASIVGLCFVMTASPIWRQQLTFGFSYLILLIVVPMYATILLKKLRNARALAESESQAKSRLLANVSHELRTPLTGIVATAQLVESETRDEGTAKGMQTIVWLANELLVEINDILDSAKYQADSLALTPSSLDLADLAAQVRTTLSSTAKAKGIDFSVGMDEAIREKVIGDAHYLGRVLMNIAGNAVKFTEKGRVDVQLKLLDDTPENYRIRFEVRDTGIGIPKELHQKIFEPFSQASTGTARQYGGTGLGMSIAREIVNLMDGQIMLESEPGNGSLFYFELVFPKSANQQQEEQPIEDLPIVYGKRILIADDNTTNLILIQQLLQLDRHSVTAADSGQAACDALAEADYDLVFLDFNMRDMDGAAVLRNYHLEKTDPAPVFFLTADVTQATAASLKDSGAVDVLHKPVGIKQLRVAVARIFAVNDVAV